MVRSNGAADSVYQQIRSLIFDREIPPGEKLSIDGLARQLGVSHTPVREALRRLEGDKLVVARQPRGYRTSDVLSAEELREMFEVRLLLEPWAARLAAVEARDNPGPLLMAELARFEEEQAVATADSAQPNFRHDVRFHQLILDSARNHFLLDAFAQLHAHLHLFRLFPADSEGTCTLAEHAAIAQAIGDSDADAAEEAMVVHLHSALDRFGEGLD